MKNPKRILLFVLFASLLAGLFAWCDAPRPYGFAESPDNIVKVSFTERGENGKKTLLGELSQGETGEFLAAFQALGCKQYWNDPSTGITGHVIEITYRDGVCEQIAHGCNRHTTDDGWDYGREYFSYEEFEQLFQQYCP